MNPSIKVPLVPASFFGIVLGLVGLGNAWRLAHRVWGLPAPIGEVILFLGSLIWLLLFTLYVGKWIFETASAIEELKHPVQCCFVGLLGVSAMLVAGAAEPYSKATALVLFAIGAIYTVVFAAWRTGGLWQGQRDVGHTTAVLYLPTVAGSFVLTASASALGHMDWGQLAFGMGLFSWIALESVLVHRLLTADALPTALRPSLGIQLAPPAVGSVAYMAITTGTPDLFAHALLGYALLQALVLIRMLPWIGEQPLGASYWGFTFGVTALAGAPLRMIERGDTGPVAMLAPWLFAGANAVIALLAVVTLYLLARGRLLLPSATLAKSLPAARSGVR